MRALTGMLTRAGQPRWRTAVSMVATALLLAACAGTSTPIADVGALSLAGSCSQTEQDGYREQARLDVDDGQVRSLAWQLWVRKGGQCRFDLAEFSQTRSRPHIELLARDRSGCKLLVYQDPRRVTLAHDGCASRCTQGIVDEAWPVMFDPKTGACADLSR